MVKTLDDAEPLPFLAIADKSLAKKRCERRPEVSNAVMDVFEHADPNAKFVDFAKSYIQKAGKEVRSADITDLAWIFGIEDRPRLKKLLVWKNVVARKD